MQNGINDHSRHPTSDDIDDVVSLDIDGGQAHQYVKWRDTPEQRTAATAPGKDHQDGGDAYMTAGESCRRALTCGMGTGYTLVEVTIAVARHGQWLVVGGEVIVDVGEYTLGDVVQTCCQIIILWSCDGQEDKNHIIDEERREDDKYRTVEFLIAEKEVEQRHEGNQREI